MCTALLVFHISATKASLDKFTVNTRIFSSAIPHLGFLTPCSEPLSKQAVASNLTISSTLSETSAENYLQAYPSKTAHNKTKVSKIHQTQKKRLWCRNHDSQRLCLYE